LIITLTLKVGALFAAGIINPAYIGRTPYRSVRILNIFLFGAIFYYPSNIAFKKICYQEKIRFIPYLPNELKRAVETYDSRYLLGPKIHELKK
jgi:hypothetical protein